MKEENRKGRKIYIYILKKSGFQGRKKAKRRKSAEKKQKNFREGRKKH